MKHWFMLASSIIGLAGSVNAFAGSDYFAPERIHCKSDVAGAISCSGFNPQYFNMDTHTVDMQAGQSLSLNFSSGVAYFEPGEKNFTVFFTYKKNATQFVKLKSVNTTIKPDLTSGHWVRFKDEFYTCDVGYMSCPVTNLP